MCVYVRNWTGDEFAPYKRRELELATHNGCVTWGARVVLPKAAREQALKMLHANHPGIVAMKSTAQSHFWWPRLDADIEATAAACETCQQHHRAKATVPTPDWSTATRPWETIHIDFAGPIDGISYLIVVDAYSKWLEVKPMHSTTSTRIIDALRSTFATFGVPRILFSDNAPNFVSNEMDEFLTRNGIKHYTSAPYHPATNGQAERMVGETKKALLKLKEGTIQCRIARFLFRHQTTVYIYFHGENIRRSNVRPTHGHTSRSLEAKLVDKRSLRRSDGRNNGRLFGRSNRLREKFRWKTNMGYRGNHETAKHLIISNKNGGRKTSASTR